MRGEAIEYQTQRVQGDIRDQVSCGKNDGGLFEDVRKGHSDVVKKSAARFSVGGGRVMNASGRSTENGGAENRFTDAQHILVHADRSAEKIRSLKYGDTFAVFNHFGDMRPIPSGEEGLYLDGTRFLSMFTLYLDGFRPLILGSTVRDDNDQLIVTLTNPDLFVDGELYLPANSMHISKRAFLLDAVCYVEIRVENYSTQLVDPLLTLSVSADFKDIYEVRGMARGKHGHVNDPLVDDDKIALRYRGLD